MLLQFTFGNFRSFKNKTTLNMKASRQWTPFKVGEKDGERVLPAAVIYGPNASGKTNIIKAAGYMREIVLHGLHGANEMYPLTHCPFVHELGDEPVLFEIAFIADGKHFEYQFAFTLSEPFSKECKCTIVSECLALENELLFERTTDKITVSKTKKALELLGLSSAEQLNPLEESVNNNMSEKGLFLTGGLLSTISKAVASKVTSFFRETLVVILEPNHIYTKYGVGANEALYAIKTIADIGPQKFQVQQSKDDAQTEIIAVYDVGSKRNAKDIVQVPIKWTESLGTIQMLHFTPMLLHALQAGFVLLVDELDASLHPELVTSIIATFNDEQLNPKRAQLVFTTHNLTYLNKDLLRRDQILFTEKDEDYISELYSLADFGSDVVRNDGSFVKQYLKGNFGALPTNSFAELAALQADISRDEEVAEQ